MNSTERDVIRKAGSKRSALRQLLLAWVLLASLGVTLATPSASARVEDNSAYTKAQTFSGALRYLRVDLGYDVVEKDPEAAYLLFKYVPSGQREPTHGSIEIIQAEERVKVYVQLPKMPEYHERMLSTGLLKKLKAEYGEPAKPKKKPSKRKDDKDKDGDGKDKPRDQEPEDKSAS